jgi:hypothetical protein
LWILDGGIWQIGGDFGVMTTPFELFCLEDDETFGVEK